MKFWMHGIFGSVLAGALWGVVWQIVATMALIVSTGAGRLQTGPAVLAGASAGLFAILFRSESTVPRHICGVLAMGVLIWGRSVRRMMANPAVMAELADAGHRGRDRLVQHRGGNRQYEPGKTGALRG